MSPFPGAHDWDDFIRRHTVLECAPLIPEIRLHLASEVVPLWQASEEELERQGLPPPFWAFAWAGGQALARYLLDHPEVVRGARVLDFGTGCGLVGIAAARAGAGEVTATDIDEAARAACRLNAAANDVRLSVVGKDVIGEASAWDLVLAGDIFYEQPMASRLQAWLGDIAEGGTAVLVGDPGRTYLPRSGLERVIAYAVRTSRELEDSDVRNAVVWRVSN